VARNGIHRGQHDFVLYAFRAQSLNQPVARALRSHANTVVTLCIHAE
jgi:hypothetical protein